MYHCDTVHLFFNILLGGAAIQDECDKHINTHGRLLPGSVLLSTSGRLRCKKIIHAVGTTWTDGRSDEKRNLFDVILEALRMAGNNQLNSIAIPPFCTNICGYTSQAAMIVMMEAMLEYYRSGDHQFPAEVHLVDNVEQNVSTFHQALLHTFGKERVEVQDEPLTSQGQLHAFSDQTSKSQSLLVDIATSNYRRVCKIKCYL